MRRIMNKAAEAVRDAERSFKTAGLLRTGQRLLQRTIPQRLFDMNVLVAIEQPLEFWRDERLTDQWQHRWATSEDMD